MSEFMRDNPSTSFDKKKKNEENPPSVIFNLELFDPTKKKYPKFDYAILLQERTGNTDQLKDPLEDNEEHQKLKAIAKKFEEKYGPKKRDNKGKKVKFGAPEDYLDLGMGYDKTDSFIDDSEAYDELVPSTLTTKFGGFYINTGTLEFKEISSSDDDEIGEPEHSHKNSKKRKIIISDDSNSDGDQDDEAEKMSVKANKIQNAELSEMKASFTPAKFDKTGFEKKIKKSNLKTATRRPAQNTSAADKIRKKNLKSVRSIPNLARVPSKNSPILTTSKQVRSKPKQNDAERLNRISDIVRSVAQANKTDAAPKTQESENANSAIDPNLGKANSSRPTGNCGIDDEVIMDFIRYINNDDIDKEKLVLPAETTDEMHGTIASAKSETNMQQPAPVHSSEASSSVQSIGQSSGTRSPPVQRMVGRPPTMPRQLQTASAKLKSVQLPSGLTPELKGAIAKFEELIVTKDKSEKPRLTKESDAALLDIVTLGEKDGMNAHQRSRLLDYCCLKAQKCKATLKARIQSYQSHLNQSKVESTTHGGKNTPRETPFILDALLKEIETEVKVQSSLFPSGSSWKFKWQGSAENLFLLIVKDQLKQYYRLPAEYRSKNSADEFLRRFLELNVLSYFPLGMMSIEQLMRDSHVVHRLPGYVPEDKRSQNQGSGIAQECRIDKTSVQQQNQNPRLITTSNQAEKKPVIVSRSSEMVDTTGQQQTKCDPGKKRPENQEKVKGAGHSHSDIRVQPAAAAAFSATSVQQPSTAEFSVEKHRLTTETKPAKRISPVTASASADQAHKLYNSRKGNSSTEFQRPEEQQRSVHSCSNILSETKKQTDPSQRVSAGKSGSNLGTPRYSVAPGLGGLGEGSGCGQRQMNVESPLMNSPAAVGQMNAQELAFLRSLGLGSAGLGVDVGLLNQSLHFISQYGGTGASHLFHSHAAGVNSVQVQQQNKGSSRSQNSGLSGHSTSRQWSSQKH